MDENRSTMWAKIAPHYRAILGMRIGRKMREGVPRIEDAPELAARKRPRPAMAAARPASAVSDSGALFSTY
jgi:hypothetical protein